MMLLKRKLNTAICKDDGLCADTFFGDSHELDFKFYGGGKGGSGGGTVYIPQQTTPNYNIPPPAPKKEETATLELADEEDEEATQRKAMKEGARSLRIPIGTGV